jgi:hypothetical protein
MGAVFARPPHFDRINAAHELAIKYRSADLKAAARSTSVRSLPGMTRLSSKKSSYSSVISWAECGAYTRMAAC